MNDRVAVVGGGVMGLATARAISRRGARATLFERHSIGHRGGASWGATRIFRVAYDHPQYVRAASRASMLWRELEAECGEPLIRRTGGIDYGDPDAVTVIADALEREGIAYERLTRGQAEERWPQIRLEGEILYQPDSGVIRADAVLRGLKRRLEDSGAEVREGSAVRAISGSPGGATVETDDGSESFDAVVIAAGAWSPQLLDDIDLPPVIVTEEFPLVFDCPAAPHAPTGIHHTSLPIRADAAWWLPNGDGGMKVAAHTSGRILRDPDDRSANCPPELLDNLREYVGRTFPGASREPRALDTGCTYTLTADENFLIERFGRITVAAGFSGHGFKFAPLVGEVAADLVFGDRDEQDVFPPSDPLATPAHAAGRELARADRGT